MFGQLSLPRKAMASGLQPKGFTMKTFALVTSYGAVAGLLYGLLEYAVLIVRPMIQWRPMALRPEHWAWEGAFLLLDILAGAILGILVGAGLAVFGRRTFRTWWKGVFWAIGFATLAGLGLASATLYLDSPPSIPALKAGSASKRPNVLLVVLDTVRADHLSLYGYQRHTTPNLETWAREGIRFRNAISPADVTLSSHASMFTGLYTSWHGAHPTPDASDLGRLEPSFRTWAEILSEAGYSTLAVLANYGYLRPEFGVAQGFGFYDVRWPVKTMGSADHSSLRKLLRPVLDCLVPTDELDRQYRRGDQITDGGLRIIKAMQGRSNPFFLSLNYMDAHDPYAPPPPYRDLFPGRIASFDRSRAAELRRELAKHRRPRDADAILNHIVSQYDAGIAFMDSELKRLFEGMKQVGLYDNTLIIVTSDHGEAFGEHDDFGHPASVHQELVHVPLLIKYPRSVPSEAGQQIEATVSGIDLLPTVLDTVGIPLPANLQGRSLRTLGPGDDTRVVMAESFLDSHLVRSRRRTDLVQRALYQGQRKLIGSTSGQMELYDLQLDPAESQDTYGVDNPLAAHFTHVLDQWIQAVPRAKPSRKMDPQSMDRLRSLGYLLK
jgi:arylsulfatase A-like enzyme